MVLKISKTSMLILISFLSIFGYYRPSFLSGVILLICVVALNIYLKTPHTASKTQFLFSFGMGILWLVSTYRHNWMFSGFYLIGMVATLVITTITIYKLLDFGIHAHLAMTRAQNHPIQVGVSVFFLLGVIWGIYWLAYYPGLLSDDSVNQWSQLYGTLPLSEWHPLIHTFLIKLFSFNGRYPALFLAIQLIFGAAVVATILARGYKLGVPTPIVYIIALFYALYPVNGYYMVTMWKDTPYAILILILFWLILEIVRSDEEVLKSHWFRIIFCFTLFGVGTVRKNGLLVIFALILCLFAVLMHKKTVLGLGAVVLGLIFAFNTYSTHALNAVKSPPSEAFSIPLQQIAATYHYQGNMPRTQAKYFETIMPREDWVAHYNPYLVDTIKFSNQFNKKVINRNPKHFIENWAIVLKRNPVIFIKAYIKQSAAIWEIDAPITDAFNLHVFRIPYYGERDHADQTYQQFKQDPKLFHKNVVWQYHIYTHDMKAAHQETRVLSLHQYIQKRINQSRALQDNSLWQSANDFLDRLFDRFNSLPQQGFTRGGLLTFVLLLFMYLYTQTIGLKKASLLMCVPVVNILSLAISIPAPQFRYVYSLSFSILPILLGLILIKQKASGKMEENSVK